MEPRLIGAYALILLLLLGAAALIAYRIYHSRTRSYARQQRRETRRHSRRLAERDDPPPSP